MTDQEAGTVATPLIVGVVGAGTMGAGIAQVCLQAGHEVLLYDVDEAAIQRGRDRIGDGLGRLVAKGGLTDGEAAAMQEAVRDAHTLSAVAEESDLVIEAALRAVGAEADDLPPRWTPRLGRRSSSRPTPARCP